MSRFTLEAKVGIFFLAALAIFGYVWLKVLDIGLKGGFLVKARFTSAEGLVQGAQVQIAGIKVGSVKDVQFDPETGKAMVNLEINDAYKNTIPEDSRVALRTKGLLGDKYVVIEPGKPNVRKLKPGEELTRIFEPTEPEKVFESLGVITQDLQALTREARKQMIDDKGSEKVGNILDNTDSLTKDLKEILASNKTKINQTLDNTDNLTKGLNEIVMRNRDKVNRTVDDLEKTGNRFSKVASDLDSITKDIREGRGTLGRLIKDESLYRDAQGLVKDVRNLSNRIQYGPGVMGRLINDPELYYEARRAIRNMNKTAEDVSEATPISTLAVILGAVLK
jgi:phospholipid/cholesterol/gamma-HCH transport system substrate-binding protein